MMYGRLTVEFTVLRLDPAGDEEEIPLDVVCSYTGGCEGRYYGEPSECYPAENPEVEWDSFCLAGTQTVWSGELTDAEEDRLYQTVLEAAADKEAAALEARAEARAERERDYSYED